MLEIRTVELLRLWLPVEGIRRWSSMGFDLSNLLVYCFIRKKILAVKVFLFDERRISDVVEICFIILFWST